AAAAQGSSGWAGSKRNSGRAGNSRLDTFSSSGQIENRGADQSTAREHVSALQGEHGSAAGVTAVFIRGVLHAKPGGESAGNCADCRLGAMKDDSGFMPTDRAEAHI